MIKLYDSLGREIKMPDTEDKLVWCEYGSRVEVFFVYIYGRRLNLTVHPRKEKDKGFLDLLAGDRAADLKAAQSPFFKAGEFYNIDPQYAVTLDKKDIDRYSEKYKNIRPPIYFWIDWIVISGNINGKWYTVIPMTGVWRIEWEDILKAVNSSPLHVYGKRKNDTRGNSKEAYVLDIRKQEFKKLI